MFLQILLAWLLKLCALVFTGIVSCSKYLVTLYTSCYAKIKSRRSVKGEPRPVLADNDLFLLRDVRCVEFLLNFLSRKLTSDFRKTISSDASLCTALERTYVSLADEIERGWGDLVLMLISKRPGLANLADVKDSVLEFVSNRPEKCSSVMDVFHKAVRDARPTGCFDDVATDLSHIHINLDNSLGAAFLLLEDTSSKKYPPLETSVLRFVCDHQLSVDQWAWPFVTVHHMLKLPLNSDAFPKVVASIAACLQKQYGHPTSWHSFRESLTQKQIESASKVFRVHDAMTILVNHHELEGVARQAYFPAADHNEDEFLLDPIVLAHIHAHIMEEESARRQRPHRKLSQHSTEESRDESAEANKEVAAMAY